MSVAVSIAIFVTATISATVIALFLDRRRRNTVGRADLVEAHNEKLKEIEKKQQSGQIDEVRAERARLRILRKLAGKTARSDLEQRIMVSPRSALVIAGILAAGIATLLAIDGQFSPRPRAQDVLASSSQQERSDTRQASQTDTVIGDLKAYVRKAGKPASPMSSAPDKPPSLPGVDIMIKRLAGRLESAPDNGDDWRMLGWSYFRTNRYREAADAYARAVALRPGNASWQSEYGAALVKSSAGEVTDKAKAAFSRALELDPSDRIARFHTALMKRQDNDKKGALEDWIALLRDYPDIQIWSAALKAQILTLSNEIGEDVSDRLPVARSAEAPAKVTVEGPSSDDIRAAQKLSPEAQSEMIRGMVRRLASRLEETPDDAEGWVRLIRSRMVLQEPEKARAALSRAIDVFSERPDVKQKILQQARSLGVSPATAPRP